MTALKTTRQQREAYLRYKRNLRDIHLPNSEDGACQVILSLTDVVHDADLALTLEEGIAKISDTVRELQDEKAVLLSALRDLTFHAGLVSRGRDADHELAAGFRGMGMNILQEAAAYFVSPSQWERLRRALSQAGDLLEQSYGPKI